jgi:hypothetical protein
VENRRQPAAVAAATRAPVRMRLGVDNKRARSVKCELGKVPSSSHGAEDERSRGFGGGSNGGRRRTGGRRRERRGWPGFCRRRVPGDVVVTPEMRP